MSDKSSLGDELLASKARKTGDFHILKKRCDERERSSPREVVPWLAVEVCFPAAVFLISIIERILAIQISPAISR